MIARRCAVRGWEHHIDDLHAWLQQFVAEKWRLPLPDAPVISLEQLQEYLPEMEFWMPVERLPVSRLDALLQEHVFAGEPRPALAPDTLNGMFKGFIDLCLQTDGRYYVVDYKTNDLGLHNPAASDISQVYSAPALAAAMLRERYDAQLVLYLLALHRQLKARLPDYDYERHMGGGVYIFVRGQHSQGQGLVALRPQRNLIESLDAMFANSSSGRT